MSKLIIANDVHAADHNPLSRVDNYPAAILEKLGHIGTLAEEHQVSAVIFTGDMFHLKQPSRVSHRLVRAVGAILQAYTCPVFIVPGNHDMGPRELESMPSQPLGVLTELCDNVTLLTGEEPLVWQEYFIVSRPWSTERDLDPEYYRMTETESDQTNLWTADRPQWRVLVAHGSLCPPGVDKAFDTLDFTTIPEQYDLIFSGHIHDRLGIHAMQHTVFCNVGSVGRVSSGLSGLMRKPSVVICEGKTLREEVLPHRPGVEVFAPKAEAATDGENPDEIARLADVLSAGIGVEQVSLDELIAALQARPEVRELVRTFLGPYL